MPAVAGAVDVNPPPLLSRTDFSPQKNHQHQEKNVRGKKEDDERDDSDGWSRKNNNNKKKLRPMNKLEVIGTNIFSKQRPIIIYNNDRYFSLWFSRLRVYRREDEKKNKESDWTRQHPLCVYQWRELKWRRKNKIDDEWRPPHSQRNFTVMCLSLF